MSATNRSDYERRVAELAEQFERRFKRQVITSTTGAEIAAFETHMNQVLQYEFPHELSQFRASFCEHSQTVRLSLIRNRE